MAQIVWGTVGQRYFEAGTDRGVLYVGNANGVPWNGLVSVSEAPKGGEPKPYYIDGVKYLNLASAEEFEATINAFSSPTSFDQCDGSVSLSVGLIVTQQPRKSFGFSYRTKVGNDVNGTDHGYKIHLVYNALAGPSQRNHSTLTNSSEVQTLSWPITTLPPRLSGHRPTSHVVIDSRRADGYVLSLVEDILYGSETNEARLPTIQELVTLFENPPGV